MNVPQVLSRRRSPTEAMTPKTYGTHPRKRRVLLLRLIWGVLALYNITTFFLAFPLYYRQLFLICANKSQFCAIGQLLPGNLVALHQLHLSLNTYVIYTLVISIIASSVFLLAGLLIFWRKSDEPLAILASIIFINFAAAGDAHFNGMALLPDSPFIRFLHIVAVLSNGLGGYAGLGLFFALFPTGRSVPRWAWMLVFLWIAQIIPWAVPSPDSPWNAQNWPRLAFALEQLCLLGTSLAAQMYRYTRVSDQIQRQQSKWLLLSFVLALLIDIPYYGIQGIFPALAAPTAPYQLLSATVQEYFHIFVPITLVFAILRYRLWDVDIIINRTLVYGSLTISVIGLYVLVVIGLGSALQAQGNLLLSLLATGLIAVLFQPSRQRLQQGVNRLMYGERDEPYRVLARLSQRLEVTLTPEAVLPTIVETVAQALKLPFAAITWTLGEGAAAEPKTITIYGESKEQAEHTRVPLVYQNEVVGELVLAPRQKGEFLTPADHRFLRDLAPQIGVVVHAVRLTADLKQLTVDLQRSRERLVTAREEERRRLRRDLHDGLGPQLSSQTLTLAAARKVLRHDPDAADRLLADATTHAQEAIADIRRLVYALRPPALDDLGLVAAMQEQIQQYRSSGVALILDAPERLSPLPAAVEVACYRITQEALTNVIRHAHARTCTVRLMVEKQLTLEIRDDGQGFPPTHHRGVGLTSMRERAEELGGTCTITSLSASGGTCVLAQLPLS